MREDICTIPISEIFEVNDGCPICRMYASVNEKIINFITSDAMMEPDLRIETNKVGFCADHYEQMFNRRCRLQLALMIESHIKSLNKSVFEKNIFNNSNKKAEKIKKVSDTCFICDKVEWGISRMINTIYLTYEKEQDFREMFNNQPMFCLTHYEKLINGADKKIMKKHFKEFSDNLTRITSNYAENLAKEVTEYCEKYNYCNTDGEVNWNNCRTSVERSIAFLSGRKVE